MILGIALALLLYAARDALRPATPVRVVPVVVRDAGKSGGGTIVQASGWVEPDPFYTVASGLTDGVVKEMLALEGQRVETGQVLARLIDDDAKLALARAEAEVAAAEAQTALAEAQRAGAQREWDNPIERTRAAAAAEAMLADAKAEQARYPSELAAAEAEVAELQAELTAKEAALAKEAVSRVSVATLTQRVAAKRAMLDSTRARQKSVDAKVRQAEAEATAARENLRLRIAESQALASARAEFARAQAAVRSASVARDEAKLRLERTEIRSPAAGVVMYPIARPGSRIMLAGNDMYASVVAKLYDPAKLQVRVDVPLAEAAKVSVGQSARVVVEILPDQAFDGVVTRIVNEADIQKNTLQVKVAIRSPAPTIKPEMLARVRFIAPTQDSAVKGGAGSPPLTTHVFAPASLVRGEPGKQVTVWIVDQGRKAALRRDVTIGDSRHQDWVEVRGLNPGDLLITEPSNLVDGQRIHIIGESDSPIPVTKETDPHAAH